MSAHVILAEALTAAVDAGLRVPCANSDLWLSDDHAERARAALRCDGCPCTTECHDAAQETHERFGVWAGHDRTPRPGRPKAES